jgi:uncharacterized cupredoxin-like copper-binding protein
MKVSKALLGGIFFATSLACLAHDVVHTGKPTAPAYKEQVAWGIAGDARAVTRTVELTMSDNMRFTPDRIEVQQGEVVRLVVRNGGALFHEIVIGTKEALARHAALMARFPDMNHGEPYMSHVKPGATGELVWAFNRPGEFDFACLVPGHYEAGMTGKIKVVPARSIQTKK